MGCSTENVYTQYTENVYRKRIAVYRQRATAAARACTAVARASLELLDASRARARLCCGAHAPGEWPERVGEDKKKAATVGEGREPERQVDGRRERDDRNIDAERKEEVDEHEAACSARDDNRRRQLVDVQLKDRRGLRSPRWVGAQRFGDRA